jgi:hypothetical protein
MQWQSVMSQLESWTSMFHYKEMSWQMNNFLGKNLYQDIRQLLGVFAHFTQKTHITMWFSKIWTVGLNFMYKNGIPVGSATGHILLNKFYFSYNELNMCFVNEILFKYKKLPI